MFEEAEFAAAFWTECSNFCLIFELDQKVNKINFSWVSYAHCRVQSESTDIISRPPIGPT